MLSSACGARASDGKLSLGAFPAADFIRMRKTFDCDAIPTSSRQARGERRVFSFILTKNMNGMAYLTIWKQSFHLHGSILVAQRKGNTLVLFSAPWLFFFLLLTGQFALTFGGKY